MLWSVVLWALLSRGVAAGEILQEWREVRLGRDDVVAQLGDCYEDETHFRACAHAVDRAGRWARPPRRVAARPGLPTEATPPFTPVWPVQYRAFRQRHDELERAIAEQWRRPNRIDFYARLDELFKTARPEIPPAYFWAQAIEGARQTTDGYSYLAPRANQDDDEFSGFGLNLDFLSRGVFVHEVRGGSPTAFAGLRPDDRIVSIAVGDGEFRPFDESAGARVAELNLSPRGTVIRVRVERDGRIFEVRVARSVYEVPNVQEEFADAIGYVRMRAFSADACSDVTDAIERHLARGARGLILDLRANGGGGSGVADCVAGLFLGDQTVAGSVVGGVLKWRASGFAQITDLALVVLIDGESASASELVAGDLQIYRRAWLVGERSSGKATIQVIDHLNPTVDVARTIGYFVLPDGRTHQGVGLTPDFARPFREGASDDDRFLPRTEDKIFAIPAPRGTPWNQTRPGSVARIEACVAAHPPSGADYQRRYAEAVLRCEGVPENVTSSAGKP